MKEYGQLRFRVSLGNYFTGLAVLPDPIVRRKRRWWWVNTDARKSLLFLSGSDVACVTRSLRGDWQANELARPLARLKAWIITACCDVRWRRGFAITCTAGNVKGAVYSS